MEGLDHSCVFCREMNNSTETNFHRLYPEKNSRVIAQTKHLIAIPCIGQLVDDHCLILPKKHHSTFAGACIDEAELPHELEELLLSLSNILSIDLHTTQYFEHGAIASDHGGCGIYHAHMHIVPNAGHLSLNPSTEATTNSPFGTLKEALSQDLNRSTHYILHGSPMLGFQTCILDEPLPSQTLRRLLAERIGNPRWDWRSYGRDDDTLIHTLRRAAL
ncbi:hypothetical protein [Stenotrophomonas tuberculopleuritidis]|uniref:hypothetical protein n=1 Tax=Stenotrophomonas tuberculopleuritidis TaxID=3055079 RepID=UPI0026E575AD|nr:hypothetical protein [Stenotrophomonas sp. 704A1]